MPLQLGDFKVPTVGDLFSGSEAIVGNVIEDVIHAVTGQNVELTPGQGIDRTKVKGPNGSGDVEFDKKVASHEEVETFKRESQKLFLKLQQNEARMKIQISRMQHAMQEQRAQPLVLHAGPQQQWGWQMGQQQNQMMNPMMLFLLGEQGNNIASNPLMLFAMMQMLQGTPIASVGGQPVNIDLTTIALLSSMFGIFGPPTKQLNKPKP